MKVGNLCIFEGVYVPFCPPKMKHKTKGYYKKGIKGTFEFSLLYFYLIFIHFLPLVFLFYLFQLFHSTL